MNSRLWSFTVILVYYVVASMYTPLRVWPLEQAGELHPVILDRGFSRKLAYSGGYSNCNAYMWNCWSLLPSACSDIAHHLAFVQQTDNTCRFIVVLCKPALTTSCMQPAISCIGAYRGCPRRLQHSSSNTVQCDILPDSRQLQWEYRCCSGYIHSSQLYVFGHPQDNRQHHIQQHGPELQPNFILCGISTRHMSLWRPEQLSNPQL